MVIDKTFYDIFQNAQGIQYACEMGAAKFYRPNQLAPWVRTTVAPDFEFFFYKGASRIGEVDMECPAFDGTNAAQLSDHFKAITPTIVIDYAENARKHHHNVLMDIVNIDKFRAYAMFTALAIARGTPMTPMNCPHCQVVIMAISPMPGKTTDSSACCPVCDGLYFRVIERSHNREECRVTVKPL